MTVNWTRQDLQRSELAQPRALSKFSNDLRTNKMTDTWLRLSPVSLDSAALCAVFLQASELYRPIGYLAGFSDSQAVNGIFLVFFTFYITVRNVTLRRFGSATALLWMFALFGAPAMMMAVQLLDESTNYERLIYWSGFSWLFVSVLLTSAILWARYGPQLTAPFFLFCIAATWVGFAVSWLHYGFLREVMAFGSLPFAASSHTTRMMGFFQHPNAAAFSLVLFFTALVCSEKFATSGVLLQSIATIACVTGVLLTGSRTSLILLSLVFIRFATKLARLRPATLKAVKSHASTLVIAPFLVATTVIMVLQLIGNTRDDVIAMVGDRIGSFSNILSGSDSDASLEMRTSILSRYTHDIASSPILGYGPDFAVDQIAQRNYTNVSQNAWLEWAARFGVPYAILMAITLFMTYRLARRTRPQDPYSSIWATTLVMLFTIATLSVVDPFWLRSAVCSIGAVVGLLSCGRSPGAIIEAPTSSRPTTSQK